MSSTQRQPLPCTAPEREGGRGCVKHIHSFPQAWPTFSGAGGARPVGSGREGTTAPVKIHDTIRFSGLINEGGLFEANLGDSTKGSGGRGRQAKDELELAWPAWEKQRMPRSICRG